MKRITLFLMLAALLPAVMQAQADKKLIEKAQKGDTKAMVTLAQCYENGAGVTLDSAAALQWYQKAAELGDGTAWCHLSRYYLVGTRLPRDTARCLAIRQEWAEKGNADALAGLGSAYLYGLGIAADTAKALSLWEESVKKGSGWGCYRLGLYHLEQPGNLPENHKKGVELISKACKLGYIDAYNTMALIHLQDGDYKKAWAMLNEGMKWGEPYAITRAATLYAAGLGVKSDEAKAQQMMEEVIHRHHSLDYCHSTAGSLFMYPTNSALRDSARAIAIWKEGDAFGGSACQMELGRQHHIQGDAPAAYRYFVKAAGKDDFDGSNGTACLFAAEVCTSGNGFPVNVEQAFHWLERGANKFGDSDCAMRIASLAATDEYLDTALATRYLRIADRLGDTAALEALGLFYIERESNAEAAAKCFQTMVDRKQPKGHYLLGILHINSGDEAAGLKEFTAGAKAGCPYACCMLGEAYEGGWFGLKADIKKAAEYYKRADIDAGKYKLAIIYADNLLGCKKEKEIAQNTAKGMALIREAADNGYQPAIYTLGICYENGTYMDSADRVTARKLFQSLADNGHAGGQQKMAIYYELGEGGLPVDTAEAVRLYQAAAAQGVGMANCYLGDICRDGSARWQNKEKAFDYYMQSHNAGETTGTSRAGFAYLRGIGVAADTAAALPYLRQAAQNGDGDAACQIAFFFEKGLAGIEADGDSAVAYYLAAHNAGNGNASLWIGRQLLREENYPLATEYLLAAATRGNVDGAVLLACCMQQGAGIEKDPETAYDLFEQAIREENNAHAYYQLGIARLGGIGCPVDMNLGRSYLDTAAGLGNIAAMYSLGVCLLEGSGCPTDTAKAITWLERAADYGNLNAINRLGNVYEAKTDFKNAALYYEKAVAAGSLNGYCNLAYCYQEGLGVVLNSKRAFDLYMVAAEHGSTRGCMGVASCYVNGIGVEESLPEAMKWFEKAAEGGDAKAMFILGTLYEDGNDGVKADAKKAREWYKKAAAEGYTPAAAALNRLR